MELSRELTAQMFVLGGVEKSLDGARARFDSIIAGGKGAEKFAEVIAAQGGDARVVEDYSRLPAAQHEESFVAAEDGYLAGLEAETIGRASMVLGAGRERLDSVIDPAVGLVFEKKVGDAVSAGERVCMLFVNDRSRLEEARQLLARAIRISPQPAEAGKLILAQVPE